MPRPKRTLKDENHRPIVKALRAAGYVVIDVADLPGHPTHNPLDIFVMRTDVAAPIVVALTAAGVIRWLDEHPRCALVQVEIKVHAGSTFTDNETTYLKARGLWPPEIWT